MPDPDWNLTRRVWGVQNGRMDRLRDEDPGTEAIRIIVMISAGLGIALSLAVLVLLVVLLRLAVSALS